MELQINHITQKPYEGRNQADITTAKAKEGFASNEWLTFLQAKEKQLKIKKGAHGVSIFKGFQSFEEQDDKGKIKTSSRPLGFANVFNLNQTEPYEIS